MNRFVLKSLDGDIVAEGVMWRNGKVSVCWSRPGFPSSVVTWDSIEDARLIHTEIGNWKLEWVK